MSQAADKIVYCRCSQTSLTSAETDSAVLALLDGRSCAVVDDLCSLCEAGDGRLAQWAATPGLIVLACHQRAVRQLMEFAGAPLGQDATVVNLRCTSMGDLASILTACPKTDAGVRSDVTSPATWYAWFPVIDEQRCVHCGKCVGFCLFGVYRMEEGKARVVQPRSCKPNCPACARFCPRQAIIFPKYRDGYIAGDDVTEGVQSGVDVAALLKGDLRTALANRHGPSTTATGLSAADLLARAQQLMVDHTKQTDGLSGGGSQP